MQEKELKTYIKENSHYLYDYINTQVLKDIAVMNEEYFLKIVDNIFEKKEYLDVLLKNNNTNTFPYLIITFVGKKSRLDYTSLCIETINLSILDKEASTYYNYAEFSLNNQYLNIELKQSKMGGMPIDEDIVKYIKEIPINQNGFENFLKEKIA